MRVLVTRPLHQQQYFVTGCRNLGLTPISLPTIDILPTDIDIDTSLVEKADLILFTSKNAIDYAHLNRPLPWNSMNVYCIGPATYDAAVKRNQTIKIKPVPPYTSEAFITFLETQDNHSKIKNAVIIKGEGGRKLIEDYFKKNNIELTSYSVYQRLCPTISAQEKNIVFKNKLDVVSITSDDGLKNLMHMVGAEHSALLLQSQLIVNSERSQKLAAGYGFKKPALVASPPGDKGQLAALKLYYSTMQTK